ncbi:hypothetical protein [Nocardia sp. NBC_00403]|uniref:hypothetical protein n=1 Tax=Nocardia sp. NBC_00403 TaxID=2975990 RepID=UPI002E2430D5
MTGQTEDDDTKGERALSLLRSGRLKSPLGEATYSTDPKYPLIWKPPTRKERG